MFQDLHVLRRGADLDLGKPLAIGTVEPIFKADIMPGRGGARPLENTGRPSLRRRGGELAHPRDQASGKCEGLYREGEGRDGECPLQELVKKHSDGAQRGSRAVDVVGVQMRVRNMTRGFLSGNIERCGVAKI